MFTMMWLYTGLICVVEFKVCLDDFVSCVKCQLTVNTGTHRN